MTRRTARQTSSGAVQETDCGQRYGRQRMQARKPAASAEAASGNELTFCASGCAPQPGRQ